VSETAVILAGGRGSRLAPYTKVLPKPLLPVGDRAILDIVLRQLRAAHFDDIVIAVGHLAHLVQAVLGDGDNYDVRIRYHHEHKALGTAGPLSHIDGLDHSFLMMNGDVLTDLDYAEFLAVHRESGNVMTIATHERGVDTDYGILHTDGVRGHTRAVVGYEEKPTFRFRVSMGVYALEPRAIAHVPADDRFDVPDLVLALLEAGEPVGSYEYDGYWLDIGRHDDYERAERDADTVLPLLLERTETTP
jgi:NDP-mannose synthase